MEPQVRAGLAKPSAWAAFTADLQHDPPRFFVDGARMWNRGRFPIGRYEDLNQWLAHNYEPAEPFGGLTLYIRRDPGPAHAERSVRLHMGAEHGMHPH